MTIASAEGPTTHPAGTQPADANAVAMWLADLGSSDAAMRDAARVKLMGLHKSDLATLLKLVQQSRPLAPSQAAALRQIVEEVFLGGEEYEKDAAHGFLGILMDDAAFPQRDVVPQPQRAGTEVPGVVVTDRIPGFCAARMLLDGDVILGTVAPPQMFASATDLKLAIGTLYPGTTVRLQVLRHGQVIQVPLTLDSRPLEVDSVEAAQIFVRRRAEKFDDYWRATFATVVKESVG